MTTGKRQFGQQVLAGITLLVTLGVLSMIWPTIIAIFLSILLLLQSLSAEPEVAILSWAKVGEVSILMNTVPHPDFSTMLT